MAQNSVLRLGQDTGYVDIHGRDIRVLVCEKTGQILIPIDELKEIGFMIYRKSQYNRLLIDDSQFTNEFNLFMLECAQTYMLKNKIAFKENDILESINKCKKLLTESHSSDVKKENSVTPQFLRNHVIEKSPGANISITSQLRKPSSLSVEKLQLHNKVEMNSKSNWTASKLSFDKNSNPEMNEAPRTNQRGSRSFDQSSVNSDLSDNSFSNKSKNSIDSFRQNGKTKSFNQTPPKNQKRKDSDSQDDEAKRFNRPDLTRAELAKPEHHVLVTCIEKSNCLWVQNMDNGDILLDIDKRIKEEVAYQKIVTRCEYNKIYLAQDEGSWYRCKPIKFKPLTVTFIDYGNKAQLTESDLREVSDELGAIPCQAIKVTFEDNHHKFQLFDSINIRVIKRFERGTYMVEILNEDKKSVKNMLKPKSVTYFIKPKPLCTLQNGQRVMIIGETEGKLILRTKECYDKLKQIEKALGSVTTESLEKIEKRQLVLCNKDELFRGQVVDVRGSTAKVELLDYGTTVEVDVSSLKNITESLSGEPISYVISPSIKGSKDFDDGVKEVIQKLVKDRVKATVVLNSEEFDLKLPDGLLSEKLFVKEETFEDETPDRVMMSDLEVYKPPLGEGDYLLYAFRDSDNVTLVAAEELAKYVEDIIQSDVESEDPYTPILGEVCYGLFQDSWSRCVTTRVMNSRFEVQFIDFGNIEILKADCLRKPLDDIKKIPVLGVPCRFVGLPSLKNIEKLLQQHIDDGETYELNVKRFDVATKRYEIEATDLYETLNE